MRVVIKYEAHAKPGAQGNEKKRSRVWIAHVKKPRVAWDGRKFYATEAVRIMKESAGYRIDFAANISGAWMPWEAIDEVHHRTLGSAKKAIRAYVEKEPVHG